MEDLGLSGSGWVEFTGLVVSSVSEAMWDRWGYTLFPGGELRSRQVVREGGELGCDWSPTSPKFPHSCLRTGSKPSAPKPFPSYLNFWQWTHCCHDILYRQPQCECSLPAVASSSGAMASYSFLLPWVSFLSRVPLGTH